jgi:hypothetical protein
MLLIEEFKDLHYKYGKPYDAGDDDHYQIRLVSRVAHHVSQVAELSKQP